MPKIDILVPVYNEEKNLPILLKRIDDSMKKSSFEYRVIAVDDRSQDRSFALLTELSEKYPITALKKKGVQGKAFSLIEAAKHATAGIVCMIDADAQYPPEAIPEMAKRMDQFGVVVARRTTYDSSLIRRIGSRTIAFVFGRMLLGIRADMQSGLKVFKRAIFDQMPKTDLTPWTLDLPLLHTALELGYTIGEVEITLNKRPFGESKLKLVGPTLNIAKTAIKLKFKTSQPQYISPEKNNNMIGAGVIHKRQQYITHTTLKQNETAMTTVTRWQKLILMTLFFVIIVGLLLNWLLTAQIVIAVLSAIYFIDVVFNAFLIMKSLHSPPEITSTLEEMNALDDKKLPIYTVLCPLYKEAHVLPAFVNSISKMEWPKNKLDVILLFEADDKESILAAKEMKLPDFVRVVVVPDSLPKTKPKACNYGLSMAKGEYVVIYDAEDVPDPYQLKKAYLGFEKVGPKVRCLQAKLNYYNPHQNWLTRFFTAEYSLWFDVVLTGLQSIETTIPLGGTSNHFRTKDLLDVEGWDPFNVTEDCDLGIRLFKNGYRTAIIDSTTLEEANSNFKNWIRQRSRWIKGYMQTYLIHMRDPISFAREQGWHALIFQLTVGGKLAFILINPFLWVMTILYFAYNPLVGATIESLYPSLVFYMAAFSLIFGNFMFIYYYMIGCAKRQHWTVIKWVFLIPFYWLMVSIAGVVALYQLITKPHYWEKTVHGLHLKKEQERAKAAAAAASAVSEKKAPVLEKKSEVSGSGTIFQKLGGVIKSAEYRASILYVLAIILSNILNFTTSAFLGNKLKFVDFGYMNTFISLVYISNIFFSAYSSTMSYKVAFLIGRGRDQSASAFWKWARRKSYMLSVIFAGIWIASIPLLMNFFHIPSYFPFFMFAPLFVIGILSANDRGALNGRLAFEITAILILADPITRFILTYLLELTHRVDLLYLAIPVANLVAFVIASQAAYRKNHFTKERTRSNFPYHFFLISLIGGISGIAFFSLDNIQASHFLSAADAGMYGVLGIFGKMIFFLGSLTLGLVLPIVARNEGKNVSSKKVFLFLLSTISVMSFIGYAVFGLGVVFASSYVHLGDKILAITPYLPVYGFGVALFAISQTFISYHLAKKHYLFPVTAFLLTLGQMIVYGFLPHSISTLVTSMTVLGVVNLVVLSFLHVIYRKIKVALNNVKDFMELFVPSPISRVEKIDKKAMRILIFNWRDAKHAWGGGAETYLAEITQRLIKDGHHVTLFCGNDGKSPRNEVVDGVNIIRRGGFYTVYVWAFLYYVFMLRNTVDLIVDCENGIPFMTPLYTRKPIFLVIHHVHQEVFRQHLRFPLSHIAAALEARLMPSLYSDRKIITVSESSKQDIVKLGFTAPEQITVINPGVDLDVLKPLKKTSHPSLIYFGRLKAYKNVDVALKAFANVLKEFPTAEFTIAGVGESMETLQAVAEKLGITKNVSFVGKVTIEEKSKLLGQSWVAVQPSMVEGWGITVIEANAAGTPVVASNVRGLRDSIQDQQTGLLCKVGSVTEFTTALQKLFSDKELREQYSKNAVTWSKRFDWPHAAEAFCTVIHHELSTVTQDSTIKHASQLNAFE